MQHPYRLHIAFIQPHLNFRDAIYVQLSNKSFLSRIESIQYNATLAIMVAIRGSSYKIYIRDLGGNIYIREDGCDVYAYFLKFLEPNNWIMSALKLQVDIQQC